MSWINTRITQLLGIRTPIICAPMAGAAGGLLASSVTAAGGFGFIGAAAYKSVETLVTELLIAGDILDQRDVIDIGVGFLCWQLEQGGPAIVDMLSLVVEMRVKAVWFAFGEDIGRWVHYVRERDRELAKGGVHHKTLIFFQTSSVEEALVAANEWKVDCIVAQGIESGGHGHSAAPPLLSLVPSILSALSQSGREAPPVLAAGGLANGAHLSSMLALGASGAVFGTRFLLTNECIYTDAQKQMLIAAKARSTVRTMAFDEARGTTGWPRGIDGRAITNSTVTDWDKNGCTEEVKAKFLDGIKEGNSDRILVWAGTGVDQMDAVQSAGDVLHELHKDASERIKALSNILTEN